MFGQQQLLCLNVFIILLNFRYCALSVRSDHWERLNLEFHESLNTKWRHKHKRWRSKCSIKTETRPVSERFRNRGTRMFRLNTWRNWGKIAKNWYLEKGWKSKEVCEIFRVISFEKPGLKGTFYILNIIFFFIN